LSYLRRFCWMLGMHDLEVGAAQEAAWRLNE
jgi:hypothetical protein